MKKYFKSLFVFSLLVMMAGCLKDTTTPERRGVVLSTGDGQAVFWLSSPPNNVGSSYTNPVTIYSANGTVKIPKQSYSVTCGGSSSPGCNSIYGKVFNLPAGDYYAIIGYSNNPNYQTAVFTVVSGGCVSFK